MRDAPERYRYLEPMMDEMTRRYLAGGLILLATLIRMYHERQNRSRPPAREYSLPLERGAATISSWSWFALLLLVPIPGLIPLDQLPLPEPARSALQIAGLITLIASVALFAACHSALGLFWYGKPALKDSHELIRRGPYRVIRHPMYTSFFLGYAGALLLLQGWVFFIPIIFAPGFVRMAIFEERVLLEHFGGEYERYRREAGRFLPRLFPKRA